MEMGEKGMVMENEEETRVEKGGGRGKDEEGAEERQRRSLYSIRVLLSMTVR